MRLIDADALYNGEMKDEWFRFKERDNNGKESFAYSCAMQRLVEAPTVDAIPVVHGRWIAEEYQPHYTCSACGHWFSLFDKTNYCPNCGAKMDGDDDG